MMVLDEVYGIGTRHDTHREPSCGLGLGVL
jgi:hypothetical protein